MLDVMHVYKLKENITSICVKYSVRNLLLTLTFNPYPANMENMVSS